MGVPKGEATGDAPLLLACKGCGTEYETDETVTNECPDCGTLDFEVVDNDPDSWRTEH